MTDPLKWWQSAVFYQIYPRSFADGNGDGVGDFAGMISRLDYLASLGVEGLWLSPFFPSPQADVGYDVADYTGVDPDYGTLDDFQRFLDGAHARGMRVILDLVLNHTSDQHPWFLESRASVDSPKRDWYVWHPGKEGGPPNDWISQFGGSAWQRDEMTGEYYYHYFFPQQPDLNWRNPAVEAAMFDAMRFWLDRGVDGFRIDAIGTVYETPGMPDHGVPMTQAEHYRRQRLAKTPKEQKEGWALFMKMIRHQRDQPELHGLFQRMRALVEGYDGDRVLIGESDEVKYLGDGSDQLHMIFNFKLMRSPALTPAAVRANQRRHPAELPPGGWPCNTLGNHDESRARTRFGAPPHDLAQARLWAALPLTLRGTPFLYNGEEIGMSDLLLDELGAFRDGVGLWIYHMERDVMGRSHEEALAWAARLSRDRCRTPQQWADAPNGGFSPEGVETWLPVNPNHAEGIAVEAQEGDASSLLEFYRALIALRRRLPALRAGEQRMINERNPHLLTFWREHEGKRVLVAMNFSDAPRRLVVEGEGLTVALSTHRAAGEALPGTLDPFEVLVAVAG